MKLTVSEFEEIMAALDSDPNLDKRTRKSILKSMERSKDWTEFDFFLQNLEKRLEKKEAKKNN